MRLTLRTMLAYMDDILEPADAEDIGGKIADSEFATGLMTRVRDVTRRMRLGAPKLRGRSMGVDPNTVAEYLDNTLSPERVPEFEKICLESDVHLAEVASSHQILALVLGEPAEVTSNCRERMYHLVHHQHVDLEEDEPAHDEIAVAPLEPAASAADDGIVKRRPEVPEYLREVETSGSGVWQWAVAASLVVLLGGAIWMAVRPDSSAPVASQRAPEAQAVAQLPAEAQADPAAPVELDQPPDLVAAPTANRDATADETSAGGASVTADGSAPAVADVASLPGAEAGGAAPTPANSAVSPAEPFNAEIGVESPSAPPETSAAVEPPAVAGNAAETPATTGEIAEPAAPDVGEALGAAPASPVGRVTTNRQVLLALPAHRGEWRRAGSNATVYSGDTLLAPPTYRSTVALRKGITMELLGSSQVTLLQADANGVPGIALQYGRVVLMNIDAAGAPLRITGPGLETVLTFAAGESAVALEAQPLHNEGVDPELAPVEWNIDLYAVSGQIDWQSESPAAGASLSAPAHRRIAGLAPSAPLTAEDFPAWIVADRLKPIEQKASDALELALRGDRAIRLSLHELVDDRKEEVRAIAARTLAQLEDYEPLLLTLSNPHQQAYWSEQVGQLRSAVARGPQSAAIVRQAIEVRRGKGAPKIYRLLWGYTDGQLRDGGSRDLVAGLDDDDLLVRVLSFWNLRSISGGRTLNYRPEDPPAKRQPHVQKWRQRDADGLIRIAEG